MIIDFHTHFVPHDLPKANGSDPSWPSMIAKIGGKRALFVGERHFRELDPVFWNVERRLEAMAIEGVDMQVISPLPELLSYWVHPRLAKPLMRAINQDCAEMVAQSGGKLLGLGILPLQDIDAALEEIEAIARMPGLVGVFAGSNVNGKSIASEVFDPVMQALERAGLFLFVHGIRPSGADRLEGPSLMNAVVGLPHETTSVVASFMARDITERMPDLQLVFSHGGGGIGAVLGRMQAMWEHFPSLREAMQTPPEVAAKAFWYDTAVLGPDYTSYLIDRVGADRLLAGTDGPTDIGQKDLAQFIAKTGADRAQQRLIASENAQRLLALVEARRLVAA